MDLQSLRIFLAVAEERSFSRAAAKVHRTQPAVSQAVRRLEADLGEELFDRSSKSGTLTDAGRVQKDASASAESKARAEVIKGLVHRNREEYAEAFTELFDDEEKEHVTTIQLQQWSGAPDAGRWVQKNTLKVPAPAKLRLAA